MDGKDILVYKMKMGIMGMTDAGITVRHIENILQVSKSGEQYYFTFRTSLAEEASGSEGTWR